MVAATANGARSPNPEGACSGRVGVVVKCTLRVGLTADRGPVPGSLKELPAPISRQAIARRGGVCVCA
jgi:hypothetical protein